jgi:hypothetical protein
MKLLNVKEVGHIVTTVLRRDNSDFRMPTHPIIKRSKREFVNSSLILQTYG